MPSSLLLFFRKKCDAVLPTKPSPVIDSKLLGLKTLVDDDSVDCPYLSICVTRNSLFKDSIKTDKEKAEEVEAEEGDNACWASYGRGNGRRLPPTIPLLARMANVSCMPWVMKRIHKEDGSLVIKEVRVKHHEYFRTRRRDGRLVLQLVGLDENCHLFKPGRDREIREEETETAAAVVVHCDKPAEEGLLASVPSPPTSPLFYSVVEDDKRASGFETMRTRAKGDEVKRSREIMLSSSMPEPAFPLMGRIGCFSDGSPMLSISRMRPVHA